MLSIRTSRTYISAFIPRWGEYVSLRRNYWTMSRCVWRWLVAYPGSRGSEINYKLLSDRPFGRWSRESLITSGEVVFASRSSSAVGRGHLEISGERLHLYVPEGTSTDRRREMLDHWYRDQLRQAIPPALSKWQPKVGVSVPKWSIRRMKTKWGSCNRETGHIWLNVELAKKHPDSLEYLAVHEMTHLLERSHGERFTNLMDQNMPDWRARRDRLNQAPLGHEQWVRP